MNQQSSGIHKQTENGIEGDRNGRSERPDRTLASNGRRHRTSWHKLPLFLISLFFFILSISLMKQGALGLVPYLEQSDFITNPANSLGLGWIFAYVVMSGSPVAAAALSFFEANVLTAAGTFTMITGSRLGASFIVLFVGFIYVLRGRDRATSLDMGLLSLAVTTSTHVPALLLGLILLRFDWFGRLRFGDGGALTSIAAFLFDPIVDALARIFSAQGLFAISLVIILVSFNLFDRCLPQMSLKASQVGRVSRLVYRPLVMFTLGAGLTLISMSVSVSLSLLVPLSARGFIRRENVIPYIMGAGVTTFIDTLFAALLMTNPRASTIVLAEMVAVAIVSLVVMLTFYRQYEHAMLAIVSWTTRRDRHLVLGLFVIITVPLLLLLV